MNTSVLGKIGGWAQFALQLFSTIAQGGLPHGIPGWVSFIGSLATAIGIHAASATGATPTVAK